MSSHSTPLEENLWYAHGVLSSASWGLIFPLGAILIRLIPSKRAWLVHAFIMLFGLLMFTAAVAIGLWQTLDHGYKVSAPHTVMGVSIFALAWTQPISGFLHHYLLRKHDIKTISSSLHIFFGRLLIISGAVNGGLGLLLTGNSRKGQDIAYGVCVGAVCLTYFLLSLWFEARRETTFRRQLEMEQKSMHVEKQADRHMVEDASPLVSQAASDVVNTEENMPRTVFTSSH